MLSEPGGTGPVALSRRAVAAGSAPTGGLLERTWPRCLWSRAEQVLRLCREEPSRPGPLLPEGCWSGPGRDTFGAGRDRSCGFVAKSRRGRVRSHRRAVGADLAAMPLEPGGTGPVALSRRAVAAGSAPTGGLLERTWPRCLWSRAEQVLWLCREERSRPGPLPPEGCWSGPGRDAFGAGRDRSCGFVAKSRRGRVRSCRRGCGNEKSPRLARAFDSARFPATQNGISSSSKPSLAGGAERWGALPPRDWP
ncbi:hypothetical protein SAMN02800692_1011 [Luteibacter sp. UNC138MFCol5.1]|nr:hypothetical protein SAMN02800692_1011 [Luteibacter sp. UNC138MFCol5.1]